MEAATIDNTKLMPHDMEAERAVLGAIILDNPAIEKALAVIDVPDFYLEAHRLIFKSMIHMAAQGQSIDAITLIAELRKREPREEKWGGLASIVTLTDGFPRGTNIDHYAGIVVESANRRRIIQLAEEVKTRCFQGGETAEEIAAIIGQSLSEIQERGGTGSRKWDIWDAANIESWPVQPLEWLVEPLIPKGGIGFMSAAPKDRKSLLTVDLSLHLAQAVSGGRKWLDTFSCNRAKTLYIAREDPARRIKERACEICKSYGMSLPEEGQLQFLIRERFNLMEPAHIAWVKRTVREVGFDFLVLDVFNRMTPGLDENSAKEMAQAVSILEELNRDLNVTILILDHTKKPVGKNTRRDGQDPNPFDLKGSVAKYGAADFMICLSRTKTTGRMQVFCENKDADRHPHFFVDVSPKDSGQPKFQYAGEVAKIAEDMKQLGEKNRQQVLDAISDEWIEREKIEQAIGLSKSTVAKHLKRLGEDGLLEVKGKNRDAKYRRKSEAGSTVSDGHS